MEHYIYDGLFIEEDSIENETAIDVYISSLASGRIFPGDYSWACAFQKLSMLGFTCKSKKDKIKIVQLFCHEDDYRSLNELVQSLQ